MRFLYKNENLPSRFISQKKIFLCNILCITKTKCFCSETLSFRNSTGRPFLWCWEMQKAGCINNLEVKIESIDHQTVYIMISNNISFCFGNTLPANVYSKWSQWMEICAPNQYINYETGTLAILTTCRWNSIKCFVYAFDIFKHSKFPITIYISFMR